MTTSGKKKAFGSQDILNITIKKNCLFKTANQIKLQRIIQQLHTYIHNNQFSTLSPYNDYFLLLVKIIHKLTPL